jgi:hypothetical protein
MHVTRLFCPPLNQSPQGEKGTLDVLMPFFLTPLPTFPVHRRGESGVLTTRTRLCAIPCPDRRASVMLHSPMRVSLPFWLSRLGERRDVG